MKLETQRISKLQTLMAKNNLSNLLISDPKSIRYFTQYETDPGERLLLLHISQNEPARLYLNQLFPPAQFAKEDANNIHINTYRDGEPIIKQVAASLEDGVTGIDKFWPSHFLLQLLEEQPHLHVVNGSIFVDDLRGIKDKDEIERMKQASHLNDQIMQETIDFLQQGPTEVEARNFILQRYQETGHQGPSFEPIVAYGANGADPHHTVSQQTPQAGDSIVVDIGGLYNGYASDMTRTFFYQEASQESLQIYHLVQKANEAAIQSIRPGVTFAEIDRIARDIISEAGYGEFFTHRLGHFIGQEAHEAGDVSEHNHRTVQAGQIFSIEPGIYLPGKLGVRIEDLVLVTEDGVEVLNHVSKEPIIIDPA